MVLFKRRLFESRQGLIYGPVFSRLRPGRGAFHVGDVPVQAFQQFYYFPGQRRGRRPVPNYVCSWVQELAFGTVSWEYSSEPLNLNGRTSLSFAVMWGVLGLVYEARASFFRAPYPAFSRQTRYDYHLILVVLMALDIIISAAAVRRQTDRHNGVPSTNIVTQFLDDHYPDSFLKLIYPNMEHPRQKLKRQFLEKKRREGSRRFFHCFLFAVLIPVDILGRAPACAQKAANPQPTLAVILQYIHHIPLVMVNSTEKVVSGRNGYSAHPRCICPRRWWAPGYGCGTSRYTGPRTSRNPKRQLICSQLPFAVKTSTILPWESWKATGYPGRFQYGH